jgi:hypothetical protein
MLVLVALIIVLPNNGFSWMILFATLISLVISGPYIVEPNATGADRKSECQEKFKTWKDQSGTWEVWTRFKDPDGDGFGTCVSKRTRLRSTGNQFCSSCSTTTVPHVLCETTYYTKTGEEYTRKVSLPFDNCPENKRIMP